jgi:hypothetical protein
MPGGIPDLLEHNMKRAYEVEWPDELGEAWLNDNILRFYLQTRVHYPILIKKPIMLTRVSFGFLATIRRWCGL